MTSPRAFIRRKVGASLLHGPRTAAAIGRPLNTCITINLWQFGFGPEDAYRAFASLRDERFQRWSMYRPISTGAPRNGPPTYIWAIEAPGDRAHVHWVLHVAPSQKEAFRQALHRWLCRMTNDSVLPDRALNIKPVTNAEGLKLYLAKGLDPALGRLWRIETTPSGIVYGRRAGTSRNLGPAEWRPRKLAWLSRRQAA